MARLTNSPSGKLPLGGLPRNSVARITNSPSDKLSLGGLPRNSVARITNSPSGKLHWEACQGTVWLG